MKGSSHETETALRRAQRWLASIILAPKKLDDGAFRVQLGDRLVRARADASCDGIVERLGAHTGGYPARIEEALAESYPALKHVIGPSAFRDLRARYLPHVPAGIYNLNDVGSLLPDFLLTDPLTDGFPFAADLARLERAVRSAFHAREKDAFDATTLAGWTLEDWGAAIIEFQPSVAVIRSRWPVRDIWGARDTPAEQIDIQLEGRSDCVLVHRAAYDVVCESIEEGEAAAIELLGAGMGLGDVADELATAGGDPEAVTRWFARWTARDLITRCYVTARGERETRT